MQHEIRMTPMDSAYSRFCRTQLPCYRSQCFDRFLMRHPFVAVQVTTGGQQRDPRPFRVSLGINGNLFFDLDLTYTGPLRLALWLSALHSLLLNSANAGRAACTLSAHETGFSRTDASGALPMPTINRSPGVPRAFFIKKESGR